MRTLAILSGVLALAGAMPAIAQQAPVAREMAYGPDNLQKLDFHAA